jgi:hypothetical protein
MCDIPGERPATPTTIWKLQIREILAVRKGTTQTFHAKKCNLKDLNEVENKERRQIKL